MPLLLPRLSKSAKAKRAERSPLPLAALEFESPSAAIIAKPIPRLSRATNLFVFLLVVSTVTASGLIQIDKIVSASGKLVADAPNIVVQPFDHSIVESINVRKGDIVRKGQLLARLNPTISAADLTSMKDQLDSLTAKAARLEAQTAGKDYVPDPANSHSTLQAAIFYQQFRAYKSSLEAHDQKINQYRTEMDGSSAQADHYRKRLGLAANVEGMRQELQNLQVGSRLNTILATDARLNMAVALSQTESESAQAGRKLAAEEAEREAYVNRWNAQLSQELADTRRKLAQARQDFTKANLHNQLVVLTAPRDAVVLSVAKISVGSVVTSAEPLMQLVPLDAPLSVEADISGIDSGYVRPGDEVTIKFDTLPFLQYGSARGTVRLISADSFSPEALPQEGGSTLPNRPRTLYYKGYISLTEMMLHDTPPGFRLMPGMPLTADVKVGTRSILTYFVSKILPIAHESMREPGA
ncbi:HlyD family type I secretion periplasmic adaptor subunit [Rhodomicrobium sp. Az07]|uniref:HlyD family type I secretion periplasmic adaptor subunit n=1 Tax=Rhodomicrobium sp. Az07 TaxID=2839034 RepID=UPI001BE884BF|nr:HlyD family type I secretion periplasmic adaptor subunit [Rhodomicrobium sp. Az07]MBT3072020.1 HlyD family type I secretion periplasmic adaptor subunit [Rhodomicrobium sp. Az07]